MEPKILQNAIKTPDGTILMSNHVHDFKMHEDKNGVTYIVDGGQDYIRRAIDPTHSYEDLTIYEGEPFEEVRLKLLRGGRGIDGTEPLTYQILCDMSDDYLLNAIEYNHKLGYGDSIHTKYYIEELALRQRKQLQEDENMENGKKFKHISTGKVFVNVHPGVYTEDGILEGSGADKILPAWLIENSKEWKEIIDLIVPLKTKFFSKESYNNMVYTIESTENNESVISCQIGRGRSSMTFDNKFVNRMFNSKVWFVKEEALFTTHDGKEIFQGDSWWYVVDNNLEKGARQTNTLTYLGRNKGTTTHFSTKEAADKYLSENRPIFVTEDGREIYVGDNYYAVNTSNWHHVWKAKAKEKTQLPKHVKAFSVESRAKEFLYYNKPCLSIKEVASVYATANQFNKYRGKFSNQGEALRKIVDTKLLPTQTC